MPESTYRRQLRIAIALAVVSAVHAACEQDAPQVAARFAMGGNCQRDVECQPGLFCLHRFDGTGFCSGPCQSHSDCGDSYNIRCGIDASGDQVCVPECFEPGYACIGDTSVSCAVAGEEGCYSCGCPTGEYCTTKLNIDAAPACEPLLAVGQPCGGDVQCESLNCGAESKLCNVPYGAPCTDQNCDVCFNGDGWSWCSKKCDWHTDCGETACRGIDPDYWCQLPCEFCTGLCCHLSEQGRTYEYCTTAIHCSY